MSDSRPQNALDPSRRLVVLDVLRGFALFGVLIVNIPFASLPGEYALSPTTGASSPLRDLIPWALVKGLGETKFVSLFSLLFGIGLVLQTQRAEARGGSTRFYLRRLFILGVVGLFHGALLWFGDILLPYALAGLVLYGLRNRSSKTLLVIAIPLLIIGSTLSVGLTWLDDGVEGDDRGLSAVLGLDEPWSEVEVRANTEGPLRLTLAVRAVTYGAWLVLSSVISFNWHVMALFLIGAALMKRGWLGADHRRGHGRLAVAGLMLGLPLETAAIALQLSTDFAPGASAAAAALLHEVGSLVLAAGYLGAVVWVVHTGRLARTHAPLAALGRTALTGYLGQSVAFNLLFPWYGLGLWGRLDRTEIVVLGCLLYGAQVALAMAWLRKYRMGPCEWVWRWATYGQRPGLRIASTHQAS